ncbi:unnamed protein product [Amoebophrya sp. A120]|nr:unnamed protein product [Amoebophrya sp. A120]|eukprot:GSA120T00000262001.1
MVGCATAVVQQESTKKEPTSSSLDLDYTGEADSGPSEDVEDKDEQKEMYSPETDAETPSGSFTSKTTTSEADNQPESESSTAKKIPAQLESDLRMLLPLFHAKQSVTQSLGMLTARLEHQGVSAYKMKLLLEAAAAFLPRSTSAAGKSYQDADAFIVHLHASGLLDEFETLDKDRNGVLDLGSEFDVNAFDLNKDGKVNLPEFLYCGCSSENQCGVILPTDSPAAESGGSMLETRPSRRSPSLSSRLANTFRHCTDFTDPDENSAWAYVSDDYHNPMSPMMPLGFFTGSPSYVPRRNDLRVLRRP